MCGGDQSVDFNNHRLLALHSENKLFLRVVQHRAINPFSSKTQLSEQGRQRRS